jgi:hypothetical protein
MTCARVHLSTYGNIVKLAWKPQLIFRSHRAASNTCKGVCQAQACVRGTNKGERLQEVEKKIPAKIPTELPRSKSSKQTAILATSGSALSKPKKRIFVAYGRRQERWVNPRSARIRSGRNARQQLWRRRGSRAIFLKQLKKKTLMEKQENLQNAQHTKLESLSESQAPPDSDK